MTGEEITSGDAIEQITGLLGGADDESKGALDDVKTNEPSDQQDEEDGSHGGMISFFGVQRVILIMVDGARGAQGEKRRDGSRCRWQGSPGFT